MSRRCPWIARTAVGVAWGSQAACSALTFQRLSAQCPRPCCCHSYHGACRHQEWCCFLSHSPTCACFIPMCLTRATTAPLLAGASRSAAITRLLFSCHHQDQWPFSRLRAPHAGSSLLACRPVGQGTQLSAICRSRICSRKSQFERPVGLQVGVWRVGGRCGVCGRAPPRCQARWADLQAHNGRYHHPPCVLVCAARGPMPPIAPTWAN